MTEVRNGGGLCFPNRDDDDDSSCPLQVSFSMEASAFKWNSEAAAYQVRSSINLYDSEEEARLTRKELGAIGNALSIHRFLLQLFSNTQHIFNAPAAVIVILFLVASAPHVAMSICM